MLVSANLTEVAPFALATVKAESANGVADAALVAIHLRRVDVPITGLEGTGDGALRLRRRDLEDPEAELRDRLPVVQRDRRNGHVTILPQRGSRPEGAGNSVRWYRQGRWVTEHGRRRRRFLTPVAVLRSAVADPRSVAGR